MENLSTASQLDQAHSDDLTRQLGSMTTALQRVLAAWRNDSFHATHMGIEDVRLAFARIVEARTLIQGIPLNPPAALADALSEYRTVLEELKHHLPRFNGWLLAERARLRAQCSHTTAVHGWIETNRKTR